MKTYLMKHGAYLNTFEASFAANDRVEAKTKEQEEELDRLAKDGVCEEFKSAEEKKKEQTTTGKTDETGEGTGEGGDPAPSDLLDVPGLGQGSLVRLKKSGVENQEQLKALINSDFDKVVEISGNPANANKWKSHFENQQTN